MTQPDNISLPKSTVDAVREALKSNGSWLDRWAHHVSTCKGGDKCTCGLTRMIYENTAALALLDGVKDNG